MTTQLSLAKRFANLKPAATLFAISVLVSACGGETAQPTPASIPFDDTTETSAGVSNEQSTTSTTVAVIAEGSSTTVSPVTQPTAPEPVITYGSDETNGALHVRNVSTDDVLNIRSGPGISNNIIGTLTHDAWHVQPTSNIASVDGILWREIDKGDGTVGYVHADYVAYNDITCSDDFVLDASIATEQTTGDLDGDALPDDVELIISNSEVHVEIAFGSGARLRRRIGEPSRDVLEGLGGYAISVVDIDGNGHDEIRIDTTEGRWTGTTFYRTELLCEFAAFGNTGSVFHLGTYGSAGSPMFWTCESFGTPDARIITIAGSQDTGEMIFTATTYGFHTNNGFIDVPTEPQYTMTAEEFDAASPIGSCA